MKCLVTLDPTNVSVASEEGGFAVNYNAQVINGENVVGAFSKQSPQIPFGVTPSLLAESIRADVISTAAGIGTLEPGDITILGGLL